VATRFYLRDTPSYEAPTAGKKSAVLPVAAVTDGNSGNPFENRSLLIQKGQTLPDSVISRSSIANTAHQDQYLGRFTSRKLAAQTITAQTWTLAVATLETNAGANSFTVASVYVWRPGTSSVVGYIYDSDSPLGVEWSTTLDGQVLTFSGAAVTCQLGDVLVMEFWRHAATQGAATAWLQQLNYNGHVDVLGTTTADPASYLETPQNLTLDTPYLPVSIMGVFVETMGFPGPIIDANGNLYVLVEGTELSPQSAIWKSADGGLTWAEQDAANRPGSGGFEDLESAWMVLSGTKIKLARMRSQMGQVHLSYHVFNTSADAAPDTWGVTSPGKSVTAVAATDIFTSTAHGFSQGDTVKFSGITGGSPLSTSTLYYIIAGSLTANTFQVSTSQAGSAVNLTADLTAGTVTRQANAVVYTPAGIPNQQQLTLLERSNGDLIMVYGEYVSGTSSRIVYRKLVSGGTAWSAAVLVSTGAIGSTAVLGASDKIHIFYKQDTSSAIGGAANAIIHRSLDSTDTFTAAETVNDTAVTSMENMLAGAVYFDDAGAEKVYVSWMASGGLLMGAFITNDGTPEAEETITDQIVWSNPMDTGQVAPAAYLTADPATKAIYCVYSNNPSNSGSGVQAPANEGDMYLSTRTYGVGWGTDVELRDGVRLQIPVAKVYTHSAGNGGAKVLGIFYDDANGPFYDEVVLAAGSTDATVTAVAAAGAGDLPVPGVAADSAVTAPAADSTGALAAPTVTGGSSVVTPPLAALGAAPAPTATASSEVVTPAVDATGVLPPPTAAAESSATVVAVFASATGALPLPTATAGSTVTSPPIDATGTLPPANGAVSVVVDLPEPTVTGALLPPGVSGGGGGSVDDTVTAPVSAGTADMPAPTVSAGADVAATVADGTGALLAPTMTAGSTVTTVTLDGTGDLLEPFVSTSSGSTVAPPTMGGTGDLPVPAVVVDFTVTAPPLDATGTFPVATTTATATVTSPASTGLGDLPAPLVEASFTVVAPAADATGTMPAPSAVAHALLAAIPAMALGELVAPFAAGTEDRYHGSGAPGGILRGDAPGVRPSGAPGGILHA
jgi:hypothetical protein